MTSRRDFLVQSGSVLAGGILLSPDLAASRLTTDPTLPPVVDSNGTAIETWLGHRESATHIAGYSTADRVQHLFVADASGRVLPLTIGPPSWQWGWAEPIGEAHAGLVGIAAYFNPGDGRHHCFKVLGSGDIFEVSFASLDNRASLSEIWLGKLQQGARGIAACVTPDSGQHLYLAGSDGLVHPLEIGANSNWVWTSREAITAQHDEIVGISAHYHPNDQAQHVFVILKSGDVWEALAPQGGAWRENWLGVLDGGAASLAGHSAANGTQHVFGASAFGSVLPLQIGAPHWKWRWDNAVAARRGAIAGVASYFHPGDNRQHVFTLLQSGDVWESRFDLRSTVATREWSSNQVPISYWNGPLGTANLQVDYQRVAAANFTVALPSNAGGDFATNDALLAAASAVGLKMFVKDGFVQSLRASTGLTAKNKQDLQAVIDHYSGHSAYTGCQLVGQNGTDELYLNDFPINQELIAFFRANDPGHACFLEIIAEYGPVGYQPLSYDQYVEKYLTEVKPSVLCFHNYSLQADFPGSFYSNIRSIRKGALSHQVPFWQFVVSSGHGAFRAPSEAELRRQAMQVLAYGGTGILWFTYVQEPGHAPAIVDIDGTPLPLYPQVQRVNADVRAVGAHLLNARSISVYESGPLSGGGVPVPQSGPIRMQGSADVTIGHFSIPAVPNSSSATESLVLVASRDAANPVSASITFVAVNVRRLERASGAWSNVGTAAGSNSIRVDLQLAAGEAELLRVFAP